MSDLGRNDGTSSMPSPTGPASAPSSGVDAVAKPALHPDAPLFKTPQMEAVTAGGGPRNQRSHH